MTIAVELKEPNQTNKYMLYLLYLDQKAFHQEGTHLIEMAEVPLLEEVDCFFFYTKVVTVKPV